MEKSSENGGYVIVLLSGDAQSDVGGVLFSGGAQETLFVIQWTNGNWYAWLCGIGQNRNEMLK